VAVGLRIEVGLHVSVTQHMPHASITSQISKDGCNALPDGVTFGDPLAALHEASERLAAHLSHDPGQLGQQ
jgi:hypothetical protein